MKRTMKCAMKCACLLLSALATFSRIPLPKRVWKYVNTKDALAFFPLVGIVQGVLSCVWGALAAVFSVPPLLVAALLCAIPFAINGGIHADGLIDTSDALASHADREKMLAIMEDPHSGAFGILSLGVYLVLDVALFGSISLEWQSMLSLVGIYGLSRCASGLAVCTWPHAKVSGMVASFAKTRGTLAALIVQGCLCVAVLAVCEGVGTFVIIAGAIGVYAWCRHVALCAFGGITGDVAGWLLQWMELAMCACLFVAGYL